MTRLLRYSVVLVVLGSALAEAQPRLHVDSLSSPSLGRTKRLMVLLPEGYDRSVKYPVLYLLHGLWGNYTDWTSRTKIEEYSRPYPMIIIMPDGENSWYVNGGGRHGGRFEEYMVHDLPAFAASRYNADTSRQALAGLSMGGYGSLMLAFRHPNRYLFAGGLSSAISIPARIPLEKIHTLDIDSVFASADLRKKYDIFRLQRNLSEKNAPYVYLCTGTQDSYTQFLPLQRELTDSLRSRKITYEYQETPGGHSWEYWDREVVPLLERLGEVVGVRRKE